MGGRKKCEQKAQTRMGLKRPGTERSLLLGVVLNEEPRGQALRELSNIQLTLLEGSHRGEVVCVQTN